MIKITIKRNLAGMCKGFQVSGHAEYDDFGEDVVCAAISILTINTVNSLDAFTDVSFILEQNKELGLIDVKFQSELDHDSELLINSWILGVQDTAESYGTDYIQLIFEEV